MNIIEDSGDVDLDALLEDLCVMEKDLVGDIKTTHETTRETRSPPPSIKRLSSPVKVLIRVQHTLEIFVFKINKYH